MSKGSIGGKSAKKTESTVMTQWVDPSEVPICGGVEPGVGVKWYEIEGKGKEVTIDVGSVNLYTTITVLEGMCGMLQCVAATELLPAAVTGDTTLKFVAAKGETYYIAVTTINYTGEILVSID